MVGGLLAGTVGFAVTPSGTAGSRFPCDGHACGCQSANDCWTGCCCLSPAQRMAWAKANGVTPPTALVKLVDDDAKTKPKHACCDGPGGSCCQRQLTTASCCSQKAEKKESARPKSQSADGPVCQRSRCHGTGQWWVSGSQPLALPERPATHFASTLADIARLFSTEYALDASAPPTRPG